MPSYTLELELLGVYSVDMPGFEIWTDGTQEGGTYSISSAGTSISITVNYGGALPSSLEFRFNDASGEGGRTIEIQSVKINNKYVNTSNFLSSDSLTNGGNATVDVGNSAFIFDATEPTGADFLPATQTFTAGADTFRSPPGPPTNEAFDMLGGRDVAFLGSGDDAVNGGAGDDYIRGGAGNDLIYGAGDNDRLFGDNGDDTIYGGTGNDAIFGGNDNDEIHGNDGDDRLHGQNGDDIITGGLGNDVITGGNGTNYLFGDEGDDQIMGGNGIDTIDGGDDNDVLYGGGGDDIIEGGNGNDILVGDTGNDRLDGNDGADVLNGRADNDELNGGAGNDILTGEDGDDILDGGDDDDTLVGGDGADTLYGGNGNDVLHGSGLTATQIITILNANPNLVYSAQTNSFYEFVTSGATWTASQTAAAAATLNGVNGHLATVTSLEEVAFLDAQVNPTNNTSIGSYFTSGDNSGATTWRFTDGIESGVTFWEGGSGGSAVGGFDNMWVAGQPNGGGTQYNYLLSYSDGMADAPDGGFAHSEGYIIEWEAGLLSDDLSVDTLYGGNGNDFIYGYGGDDFLSGGNNADVLFGGTGNDTINGDAGADILVGGDGNDTMDGGSGNDIINAGGGDDNVDGGANNDTIYGDGTSSRQNAIDAVLAANPGVVYSSESDSFYFLQTTGAAYATARTTALATTINGVGGHLANITSAAENTFIDNLIVADTWIGGTDAGTEGVWIWQDGPEAGQQFWAGDSSGSAVGGAYENWNGGEPNNSGNEDAAEINTSGGWNDQGAGASNDYIIEWSASEVLGSSGAGNDTLNGGDGDDIIYGDYVVTGTGTQQGWYYQYYDLGSAPSNLATAGFTLNGGRDNSNTPADTGITQIFDPSNYDTGDNFALKFTTTLTITTGGTYTFRTRSDDGSALFLDGVQIVNNDGLHGATTVTSAGQSLTAGTYTLEGTFFERGGGQVMEIDINGPDTGSTWTPLQSYADVSVANVGPLSDGDDIINGEDGLDTLYGGGGADTFIFEAATAFADTDVIMDFSQIEGDALDISDIITGFSGTITDYVQFTISGGDTLVQVDANGTTGGASFSTIAELDSVVGLDVTTLYNNGNIIV
jgi:Ca2+-binding RTX toxin-like protein